MWHRSIGVLVRFRWCSIDLGPPSPGMVSCRCPTNDPERVTLRCSGAEYCLILNIGGTLYDVASGVATWVVIVGGVYSPQR